MATTAGDRLFCDTNVLLSAIDRGRALHAQALHVLNVLPNQGVELCVSGQVVREFLAVCTRPVDANGFGLSPPAAADNIKAILERSTLLEENRNVAHHLLRISRTVECLGRQIHDANIVATMHEHGLTRLVTGNVSDFRRFADLEILGLARVTRF